VRAIQYTDLTQTTLRNGEWYAFDLQGFKFYARVFNNGATGHLELTQILDPYICRKCGKGYQDGEHFDGRKAHAYEMSGATALDKALS